MTTYLLGAIVRLWSRISKGGIDKVPAVVEDRRDRDAYEAEIAKVDHDHLSAKDEREVAELRAFVEKIGTGEFPALAFLADPLGAPIPEGHGIAEPTLFNAAAAAWLLPAWPTAPTVSFSSVQVSEPAPFEPESFTGTWNATDVERMVAEAKAAAR